MRTVFWTVIVVAVAGLAYLGRAWADDKDKKQTKAAPRTRIALVNLTLVLKNYDKYKKFQNEIKEIATPFQEEETELRKQMEELRKKVEEANKAGNQDEKKELEQLARQIRKKQEDNSTKAKLKLGKKTEEELRTLYKDVAEVVREHATARGIDLVLQYNDATTPEDFMSSQNIARKLQTGALMPLYATDGMDISDEILALLNKK